MASTSQRDSLLGGTQRLPPSLNLARFAAARLKEIAAMRRSLKTSSGAKLAFQKLPVHMRRRVMSHSVKRLPRRLREMHLSQMRKSGMPPKQKRPSRKYRRRPRNLLDEYERRRRRVRWLETHIWHAKRFHMVEKWGYKLPDRPCDKAFRACYRATAKHCLLQDISYYSCVEIEGPRNVLLERLKEMCDPRTGLGLGAKAFLKGSREGQTVLFRPGSDSKQAVGGVYFNWKPSVESVLWFWVHPAFYAEVLDELVKLLSVSAVESDTEVKERTFVNKELSVRLSELRFELTRFRLTGPLSHAVLQDSLKIADPNNPSEWFKQYLSDDNNRQNFANQIEYWKSITGATDPAELSPHLILSLIVTDPRFNLPSKRMKAVNNTKPFNGDVFSSQTDIAASPLWDESVRQKVKQSKLSNATIAEMRSQLLVPGTELEGLEVPVPIIIIQRPGSANKNLGYAAGWDVIVPSGWAQAFWMAFVMRGARTGGLRESSSMDFEMGRPDFLKPDTLAGRKEEEDRLEEMRERYFRLPPNKRTNYCKYSIVSPFKCDWNLLVNDWMERKVDGFRVLRDIKLLQSINSFVTKNKIAEENINFKQNYIVPVRLKMKQKGCPRQFSVICLPKQADFKIEPVEPKKEDPNQASRKRLRKEHKELLKTLRRRRKQAKKNKKEKIPIDIEMLAEYRSKMRTLWLPEAKTIRNSSSREVIGFVTKGGFSYSSGQSCAVGYIVLCGIPHLNVKHRNVVLIRNTTSRQYRQATIEIAL